MNARGAVWAAVIALAMMLGGVSAASAQGGDDPAQVEAGQAVYEMSCAGCHAEDGTGVAGRGRPLVGIASQGDRAAHIESIVNGIGPMPAFGDLLAAEDVEAVASYVRLTFVAEEEAAAEELAETGVETPVLALTGLTMVAAGALLVRASRRD